MKKNRKTYLLLTAVIAVWGFLAFKIFNGLNPDKTLAVVETVAIEFTPKAQKKVDTFSISNASRDPFLGTLVNKNKRKSIRTATKKNEKDSINKPTVTYGGLVKKHQSSQQVFVVNINNRQYLLKKGQAVKDIQLIRGDAKQIVIRYQNKNQTIDIQ